MISLGITLVCISFTIKLGNLSMQQSDTTGTQCGYDGCVGTWGIQLSCNMFVAYLSAEFQDFGRTTSKQTHVCTERLGLFGSHSVSGVFNTSPMGFYGMLQCRPCDSDG